MIAFRQTERSCRICGRGPTETRFKPLQRTICAEHDDARKAERAAVRPPAPPRPTRSNPGSCPEHLAFVRTLPCCVGWPECGRIIHAHHVRTGNTGGGTGMKPADRWTVPLCPRHHTELHQHGQRTFEATHRLDLHALALRIAAASPALPREAA